MRRRVRVCRGRKRSEGRTVGVMTGSEKVAGESICRCLVGGARRWSWRARRFPFSKVLFCSNYNGRQTFILWWVYVVVSECRGVFRGLSVVFARKFSSVF